MKCRDVKVQWQQRSVWPAILLGLLRSLQIPNSFGLERSAMAARHHLRTASLIHQLVSRLQAATRHVSRICAAEHPLFVLQSLTGTCLIAG